AEATSHAKNSESMASSSCWFRLCRARREVRREQEVAGARGPKDQEEAPVGGEIAPVHLTAAQDTARVGCLLRTLGTEIERHPEVVPAAGLQHWNAEEIATSQSARKQAPTPRRCLDAIERGAERR